MHWVLAGVLFLAPLSHLRAQDRRFTAVNFEDRGGTEPHLDSELMNPWLLATDGARFVLYDGGSLKAFGLDGALLWVSGRSGQGPEEFRNVTDLKYAANQYWAVDASNGRLARISATGEWHGSVRVPGLSRVAPLGDGRWIGATSEPFLVLFDEDGAVLDRAPLPDILREHTALERQLRFATDGTTVVYAVFSSLPYLLRIDATDGRLDLGFVGEGLLSGPPTSERVERLPNGMIARVAPDTWHFDVGTDGRHLYVLTKGAGGARTVVDIYSTDGGEYVESVQLPREAFYLAVVEPRSMAVLLADPIPHVRIWKWEPVGSGER